jgi:hypothetical protein
MCIFVGIVGVCHDLSAFYNVLSMRQHHQPTSPPEAYSDWKQFCFWFAVKNSYVRWVQDLAFIHFMAWQREDINVFEAARMITSLIFTCLSVA